jgi:hypothetical protein
MIVNYRYSVYSNNEIQVFHARTNFHYIKLSRVFQISC